MKILKSSLKFLLYFVGILILVVATLVAYFFIQINRSDGQIITSEGPRKYLLHVPESYDAGTPTPLVISIHGFAEWPAHQMQISHWNELADENNFIVVYPRGTDFPLRWRTSGVGESLLDVEFIDKLITEAENKYTINPQRIYVNGLSNGGGHSWPGGDPLPRWIVGKTTDDINSTRLI